MDQTDPMLEQPEFKYIRTVQHGMIVFRAEGKTLSQFFEDSGLADTADQILSAGFIENLMGQLTCFNDGSNEADQQALDALLAQNDNDITQISVDASFHVKGFQERAWDWANAAFGETTCYDIEERCLRFLEEAGELVQALGLTEEQAQSIMTYVYNRDKGETHQEIAGVEVALSVLSSATGLDKNICGETELARCWDKIDKIREKQKNKPKALSVTAR